MQSVTIKRPCLGPGKVAAPAHRSPSQHRCVRVCARENELDHAFNSPLFNSQFMGVLQGSLARQGPDALMPNQQPSEPRASATVEVLATALGQSKQTLAQLMQWREQLDRLIAIQQKQVDRMEFALNKSRNDDAYMRALKEMLHGDL